MEKDLVEVFQKVADAAAAVEEERCVDALKVLKGLPITKDVLLSTKIGVHLRPLTKHPRKRIQAVASDVLEVWKAIFREESRGNIKEEGSLAGPKKQGKQGARDKNPCRDRIREGLEEALGKVGREVDDQKLLKEVNKCDPGHVAAMVEDELFKNWGLFNTVNKRKFKNRYRSLLFNIKDPKNPDFRRKVLLGEVQPETIVGLNTEGMASEARRLENQKIGEKAMFKRVVAVEEEEGSSGMFTCGKCKKDQTTYFEMQTRRADEPMTAFVTCLNCGHRWKS